MGVGAGCQAQTGYAVLQALVDPSLVSDALGFMMLGMPSASRKRRDTHESFLAQLLGTAIGLSIAGTMFVNVSIQSLRLLLPDAPQTQLYRAITGTSGEFFTSLPPDTRRAAADIIVDSIGKL